MSFIAETMPQWNSRIALLLYWLPLVLCVYGYMLTIVQRVRKDRAASAEHQSGAPCSHYHPSITVGSLLGYAVLTVCPALNLLAALFDVAPTVFRGLIRWCGQILDAPLVPKR